MTQRLNKNLL